MAAPSVSQTTMRPRKTPWLRHEVPAGFAITAALLVAGAFLLAHTVLRNAGLSPREIDAIRRTLVPEVANDLNPEPLERWLFVLLTLVSPLCVYAGLWVSRRILRRLKDAERAGIGTRLATAAALAAGGAGVYLLHGKSLFLFFVFPESPLLDLGILCAAVVPLFFLTRNNASGVCGLHGSRPRDKPARLRFLLIAAVAFLISLLPRGLSIHSVLSTKEISPFAWEGHFQAVAYSLSQVYAGKPLLTASPPLYGYYADFLVPIFKLAGLSVFKFCVTMGVIQAIALTAILGIAASHPRMRTMKFLCCAMLLYFAGSTCLVGRRPFDPVFQYWPVRFLFPALAFPVYLWAARRSSPARCAGLGVFIGLALMWNLETGIAVAGAALFTLALEAIAPKFRGARWNAISIQPLLFACAAMLVTAGCFWWMLQAQADWKTPLHQTWEYQKLFYQTGFMMAPMPLAPHPWWLVIAAYLLGLGFGIRQIVTGTCSHHARHCLFLSVLGLGLFTYYQGRSVDFNLMNASWPAMILGFAFADRLLRSIRAGLVPKGACWATLPIVYLGVMAAIMLPPALARVWNFGSSQWRMALAPTAGEQNDPASRRVAFIRNAVGKDPDCVILADYQAVYFVETGLRSSLDAPGLSEIFFTDDVGMLRSGLVRNPPRHLFIDEPTIGRLQLDDTIKSHFKMVSMFPDGKLFYMEPRDR